MPPAIDGDLRKNFSRKSRRSRAANNPTQLELSWDAAQENEAPNPRTQDELPDVHHVHDVAGLAKKQLAQRQESGSGSSDPIISVAIILDMGAIKRFLSNSVPSFENLVEHLAAVFALLATIHLCIVGGWTRAEMFEWLVACVIAGELYKGNLPRIYIHCIMAVCAISLVLS